MVRSHIEDRLQFGLGQAARKIGERYEVFRPRGDAFPLARANRVAKLHIALSYHDDKFRKPASYGEPFWWGIADTKYIDIGDYISGPEGVFFLASKSALSPALFVKARRIVTVSRPVAPTRAGLNSYGGVVKAELISLLTDWPAGFFVVGQSTRGILPSDVRSGNWSILLPRIPKTIRSADLIEDDAGRRYVVALAEESELGWRLLVSQAGT